MSDDAAVRRKIRLRRCEITETTDGYIVKCLFMNSWRSDERTFGPFRDFDALLEWIRLTKYQVETLEQTRIRSISGKTDG
jgi:hypothetical protein